MSRRILATLCCLAVALLILFAHLSSPPPSATAQTKDTDKAAKEAPPPGPRFLVEPYLQYATTTSIIICWETSFPAKSFVRYGVGWPTLTKSSTENKTFHQLKLDGLETGKNYVYQVESEGADGKVTSTLLTFQPAVAQDQAYSFVLIGDTQRNPKVTEKIANLAWLRRPNFVVHLGDVVDTGSVKEQWLGDLFGPCKTLFSRVPVYPCIGNHEKNHAHYYEYFALPEPEYCYRFRYGNADFFSLDTNKKVDAKSEQYRWLDGELARSTAKWKFVFHHHPAYSSDEDDYGNTWKGVASRMGDANTRNLVSLYEKHNIDMVFNGHVHMYERTWPLRGGKVNHEKGIPYITSGGGGGRLESPGPIPTWFKAQTKTDFHFCHIAIHGDRMMFKAFDQQGILFDSFDLDKR